MPLPLVEMQHSIAPDGRIELRAALGSCQRPVRVTRIPMANICKRETEEWKKSPWCNTANHNTEDNPWADETKHPWKCQMEYSTAIGLTSMDKWFGPLGHLCGPRGSNVIAIPLSNKMVKMRGAAGNAALAALLEECYPALRAPSADGWFLRLSDCSPKDSPFGGAGPHATLQDALHSIDGSLRSQKELARAWAIMTQKQMATMFPCRKREDTPLLACDGEEAMTTLYLAPFDKSCDTLCELRCFVHDGRLTAITQYDWFSPGAIFCSMDDAQLEHVAREVDSFLQRRVLPAFTEAGGISSFTMDVEFVRASDEVRLIELNCFGAHLAAASGLFHWLRDHDELHNHGEQVATQPICVRVLQAEDTEVSVGAAAAG